MGSPVEGPARLTALICGAVAAPGCNGMGSITPMGRPSVAKSKLRTGSFTVSRNIDGHRTLQKIRKEPAQGDPRDASEGEAARSLPGRLRERAV